MTTLYDLLRSLEKIAPLEAAIPSDNPGMQIGTLDLDLQKQMKIKYVAFSVVPSAAVIVKSTQQKAQILITYLPLFTQSVNRLAGDVLNRIRLALKDKLSVHSVASGLIGVENGLAESIASILGLQVDQLFSWSTADKTYSIGRQCIPRRSITLEILVRLTGERFHQQYINYSGRLTGEVKKIAILPFDNIRKDWILQGAHEEIDTLICSPLSLENQVLAHELRLNTIQVPQYAMATIGLRRLLQLIQIEYCDLNTFHIEPELPKPLFFL